MRQQGREDSANLLYGIHAMDEAIGAGKKFERIYIQNGLNAESIRELKLKLHKRSLEFLPVPIEKLNKLAPGRKHQGVVAFLSSVEYAYLSDVLQAIFDRGENPLILILDRITDVRNFGAVCRTAECSGVHAIVIPSRGAAMIGPDALKTSAGALNRVTVCKEEDLEETAQYLKDSGLQVVSCTEKTDKPIYKADLTKPTAIIMGSEEDGVSAELLALSDERLLIPMAGEIASLNVSVAAGIILFEAVRQRQL